MASHRLVDLRADVVASELTTVPTVLIDTAGTQLWETDGDDSVSKGNEGEADIVAVRRYVAPLLPVGCSVEGIDSLPAPIRDVFPRRVVFRSETCFRDELYFDPRSKSRIFWTLA